MAAVERSVELARETFGIWAWGSRRLRRSSGTGQQTEDLHLYSPAAGLRNHTERLGGERIRERRELYEIADLSRVWILADLFEAGTRLR